MPKVTMAVLVAAAALLQGVQLSGGAATGDTEASSTGEMASDFSSRPLFPKMRPMRPLRRMMKPFFPRLAGVRSKRSKRQDEPTDKETLAKLGTGVQGVYNNLKRIVDGKPTMGAVGQPTKADWDEQLSHMELFMDRMMKMNDCYKMTDADKEPLKKAMADIVALKDHKVHLGGHDTIMGEIDSLGTDFAEYVKGGFMAKLKPLVDEQDYLAKVELRMEKLSKDMGLAYPAWAQAIAGHAKEIEAYMSEHQPAADSPDAAFIKTAVGFFEKPASMTPPVKPTTEYPYGVSSTPPVAPTKVLEPVPHPPGMFTTKTEQQLDQEHDQKIDAYIVYLKKMQGHYAELSAWAKQKKMIEEWVKFDLQMNAYALAKAKPVTKMITDTIAEIKTKRSHCAKPDLPQKGAATPDEDKAAAPDGDKVAAPDGDEAAAVGGDEAAAPDGKGAVAPDGDEAATPDGKGAATPDQGGAAEPDTHD